ncbi:MAG: porin family protein [Alphaproteobacteria bacterium]|nr:porin family protein [Alphaproteobacteria bacterium]
MKKIFSFITIFLCITASSFAHDHVNDYQKFPHPKQTPLPSIYEIKVPQQTAFDSFFFKPSLSIEYNAPRVFHGGTNADFRVDGGLFHQLSIPTNIALGGNFRVHRYLGFNINWAQSTLINSNLKDVGTLSDRAKFKIDHTNISALFYAPIAENIFEIFGEAGVSDMRSRLTYSNANNVATLSKTHETVGFYGAGFQFLINDRSALRFSWQRYAGKLGLLDANYETIRIGYLRSF